MQMLRIIIILLTCTTAAIHFSFFIPDPSREIIYGLNALGYVALVALLYLPLSRLDPVRPLTRRLLMGYAAATIIAYLGFGFVTGEWTVPLGPITKLIEGLLIGLLWWEERQAQSLVG